VITVAIPRTSDLRRPKVPKRLESPARRLGAIKSLSIRHFTEWPLASGVHDALRQARAAETEHSKYDRARTHQKFDL